MTAGLNKILLGWLNNFSISRITYIWDTVKALKEHLGYKLYKWFKEKSQRAGKFFRQRTYEKMVKYGNLLDIEKYAKLKHNAKA